MIWGMTQRDGWFFSDNPDLNYYQQVRGNVVAYVERMGYFYVTKMYYKGQIGACELEARIQREYGAEQVFEIAEIWLERYQDGDPGKIEADKFHIWNEAWSDERKHCYLQNYPNWRENYAGEGTVNV
ncbi:hypothetical protein [Paenibacillus hexagrammi]|uniref:Uncharacterized protein n=1 Tax=Paenibacillus hexagrammi TaxID=2908839 RepID=A0ABY3SRR0_9BACL|nr:hypothetical protein [Paenibacillus sp. YPD9-1]UJF36611.1 hypothetical protein L0M14_30445 [Paenibacillus sp. YPD9-1]